MKIPFWLLILFSGTILAAQSPPTGTQHAVSLTWTAPSPVGGSGTVSGYNVYRSTGTAAFAKVNTVLIATTSFTDSTVATNTVYTYCATTVDTSNNESACSATATATVPSNPNPPTGLTAVAHSGRRKGTR